MKKQRRGLNRYNVVRDSWRSLECQNPSAQFLGTDFDDDDSTVSSILSGLETYIILVRDAT